MASVIFYQRTTKGPSKPAPIRVRVVDQRGQFYGKTHLELQPKFWNPKAKTNIGRLSKSGDFTNRDWFISEIEKLENAIRLEFQKVAEPNGKWLAKVIDKAAHPEKYEEKPLTLFEWLENHIRESEETNRVGYRMISGYNVTLKLLKEFSDQNREQPLNFNDINRDFNIDFVQWLKTKNVGTKEAPKNYKANTIAKNIRNLKAFLNEATKQGVNSNMAFREFEKKTEDTDTIYLTPKELQTLWNLDLSNKPHLERVRDLFLVGCWTGLRFGDLSRVRPENIKDGFIEIEQEKTKGLVIIPLHHYVTAILDKYNGELPKAISNQKTNKYLKDIARLSGLTDNIHITETVGGVQRSVKRQKWELVTTHTARRSFASNQYRSGFPATSLMRITGHKTERAFLRYIRLSDKEHAKMLREHWLKQGNHLKVV